MELGDLTQNETLRASPQTPRQTGLFSYTLLDPQVPALARRAVAQGADSLPCQLLLSSCPCSEIILQKWSPDVRTANGAHRHALAPKGSRVDPFVFLSQVLSHASSFRVILQVMTQDPTRPSSAILQGGTPLRSEPLALATVLTCPRPASGTFLHRDFLSPERVGKGTPGAQEMLLPPP